MTSRISIALFVEILSLAWIPNANAKISSATPFPGQPLWAFVQSEVMQDRILHGWGAAASRWQEEAIPYFKEIAVPVWVSNYVSMTRLRDDPQATDSLRKMSSWTDANGTTHRYIVMECLTNEFDPREIIAALIDLGYDIDPGDPHAKEKVQLLLRQPGVRQQVIEMVGFPDVRVANGEWDTEIVRLAKAVREIPHPVLVRFMQEFLGGIHKNDVSGPKHFKAAWRRFVDLMRSHGASNVEFVWHPNQGTPSELEEWWPGDAYVDWVAASLFQGRDFSKTREHSAFAALHGKPFLIAESAPTLGEFAERGTTDPRTWEDYFVPYFALIREDPNIRGFIYINNAYAEGDAFDWWPTSRVQENEHIRTNYIQEVTSEPYIDNASFWRAFTGQIPAFPGAEGFGSTTPAGRSGTVVRVTSLLDDGPGTLREALAMEFPRTIVFATNGVIELSRPLFLGGEPGEPSDENNPQSFVTMAGQTAPGGGITIANYPLSIRNGVHDVVVRHLRFRNLRADVPGSIGDGVQLAGAWNVVLDHLSVAWATDEGISLEATSNAPIHDVTIQHCLVAEGLFNGEHPNGMPHSRGIVVSDGAYNVSVHHNFLISNNKRNPSLAGNSRLNRADFPLSDVRYNLVYNFGQKGVQFSGGAQANAVGNLVRFGPDTTATHILDAPDPGATGTVVYLQGNTEIRRVGGVEVWTTPADQTTLVFEKTPGSVLYADVPFVAPPVTPPDGNLEAELLAWAGALPHDAHDAQFTADYENYNGRLGADDLGHDDIIVLPPVAGAARPDTDGDGMSDVWERIRGLNPHDPADAILDANGDGYTNLEEYLNVLAFAAAQAQINDYPHWQELHFSAEQLDRPELLDPLSDPDLDHAPNLTEYVFATPPLAFDAEPPGLLDPWMDTQANLLAFSLLYYERADVDINPFSSSELSTWQAEDWPLEPVPINGSLYTRDFTHPMQDSGRFFHLEFSLQP